MSFKMFDVVIGTCFFFTLASLVCSGVRELIDSWLGTRGKLLEQTLREMLDDPTPMETISRQKNQSGQTKEKSILLRFYDHPLIYSQFKGDYRAPILEEDRSGAKSPAPRKARLPAYIERKTFQDALFAVMKDIVAGEETPTPKPDEADDKNKQFKALREAVAKSDFRVKGDPDKKALVPSPRLRKAFLWALDDAGEDFEKAKNNLGDWFEASVERTQGRYKRNTQAYLFGIGLFVAMALNMNVVDVVKELYVSDQFRDQALSDAIKFWEEKKDPRPESGGAPTGTDDGEIKKEIEKYLNRLDEIHAPIGWTDAALADFKTFDRERIALHIAGWTLTAIAMVFGAAFWFDLLNMLLPIRTSRRPEEGAEAREK